MRKQKTWYSVEQIFMALNNSDCKYAVLRNYENMSSGNPFINGHDDIDLLCNDLRSAKRVLNANCRFLFPTVNSYYIRFENRTVNVDIRFVGDGYYDTAWEQKMLANRILFHDCIYVLHPEDYFYSLAYHALFQKKSLSDEYHIKLISLAKSIGITCESVSDFARVLEEHMIFNHYLYTITRDPGIVLNFDGVDKTRIKHNGIWIFKRNVLDLLKRNKRIGQKYV